MQTHLRTITIGWAVGLSGLCSFAILAEEKTPSPKSVEHRAFLPIVLPKLPTVKGESCNSIDVFLLAELKEFGLSPEADRPTLIRRVSFDLTGLPPTIAEIDAFVGDQRADAYERMVERYLASPRYGERWGKYWLDAAGYADSNGYFNADSDRPLAWRYRDYVVRAMNADKPYDQFVREQLAGDEIVGYVPGGDVTPAMVDSLTATHFLRNAPDGTGESDGNPDEVRTDRYTVLEGNLQNAINCLLGITIQCARCHDHKFEPVSQVDYYALQSLYFPVYNPERWTPPNQRVIAVGTVAERTDWQRRTSAIDRQVKSASEGLTSFTESLREQIIGERLSNEIREQVLEAFRVPKDKKTKAHTDLLAKHQKEITVSEAELDKRFPEYIAYRTNVKATIAQREKERPAPQEMLACYVETDRSPAVHHVLKRGQHNSPGKEVQPGIPAALSGKSSFQIVAREKASSGRRLAFANWLTHPDHPLFARVMVNRIWQQHFGTGLIATPDNLGRSGAKASHPDLLDALSAEFVRSGWSVKHLHRLILQSRAYRQGSTPRPELDKIDPDNRLLSHFPLRRVDAEALRDSMLQIAGQLDVQTGGPYIPSQRNSEGVVVVEEATPGSHRRSLYLQQRRTQVVTQLQLFDAPTIVGTCAKRSPSTVPLQALAQLNSEFARRRAKEMAERIGADAQLTPSAKIYLGFRFACGRLPSVDEREAFLKFLTQQQIAYQAHKDANARSWTDLCQMILSCNAFLYIE